MYRPSPSLLLCGLLVLAAGAGCGSSGVKKDAGDAAADAPPEATAGDAPGKEVATDGGQADATDAAVTEAGTDAPAEVGADATGDGGPADVATGDGAPDGGGADRGAETGGDAADGPAADAAPLSKRIHAIALALGSVHTCALLDDHRVKCWGVGEGGMLGLGDKRSRGSVANEMGNALPFVNLGTGRTAKSLAAGRYATCALLDDDAVKCWGIGLLAGRFTGGNNIGDEPNEMGDQLEPLPVGAGRKAVAIGMGYYTACFARDDRTLRCWDTSAFNDDVAATTDGTAVVRMFNGRGPLALFDDGSLREIAVRSTSLIANGTTKVSTASGSSTGGCALLVAGGVTCWGGAQVTAFPPELFGGRALAYGEFSAACGVTANGTVRCWGSVPGSAGPGSSVVVAIGAPVSTIAAGNGHWCALTEAGDVKCWDFDSGTSAVLGGAVHTSTRWDPVDLGERP